MWEVKPKNGADPKRQLELYRNEGNLQLGHRLGTIDDIPIADDIKMIIEFPERGVALYSFYRDKDKGRVRVSSVGAMMEVQLEKARQVFYDSQPIIPIPGIRGIPLPVFP